MDAMFKALADPTRRQILVLLRRQDLTAGDIADQFPVAWASVSHHLGVLREAGLVIATRDGQFIRYTLNPSVLRGILHHLRNLIPPPSLEGKG